MLKGKGLVIVKDMADEIAKSLKELKSRRSVETAWFLNRKIKFKQHGNLHEKEIRNWSDLANIQ